MDAQSGAFSARVDGQALDFGRPAVDLHRPHRILLRNFLPKPVELKKGARRLELQSAGPAAGGNEIGIDFLWVQKK
jgi:hypothetical protein